MTRYTVLWDPDLERQFIETWVTEDSETRGLLTEIANWVDANLSIDPENKGQEDDESIVCWYFRSERPLSPSPVRVVPEDRQVHVIRLIYRK